MTAKYIHIHTSVEEEQYRIWRHREACKFALNLLIAFPANLPLKAALKIFWQSLIVVEPLLFPIVIKDIVSSWK